MKGVTSEVISQVRARANIQEIVAETVVLKRAGRLYKGLCPFHSEKTPSFTVNPERGIFKCFGCNEGGDVFAFVQKTKGLGFVDTVRELAHRYGVPLVETAEDRREYDRRTLFLLLYQQANEYFRRLLQDPAQGVVAREYLKKRGVTEDIIERFQLGYAPQTWDGLLTYLTKANKVAPQTLVEAGLVRNKAETNKFYDLFRHRLMIPIHDEQGRVIAFGGRALDGEEQVKYINSPESPIYTKGEHLYALHQAKDAIKRQDSVIVVEGYFDAITAHQYGFENTVATLGTALTERQAKLLVRFSESRRVYLCFDADTAGQRAVDHGTQTMNQVAEGIGIELRVIAVPGGKDPDECLRGSGEYAGPAAFQAAYSGAPLMVDYQLEKAISGINIKSHTGRIEAARMVVPILAGIKNAVGRGEYIRQWALRLNVKEEELLTDVGTWRRQNRIGAPVAIDQAAIRKAANKNAPRAGHIEAERQLLALFLMSKEDHEAAREALTDDRLIEPVHQHIKEAVEGIGRFTTPEDFQSQLMDRLAPDPQASAALIDIILKVEELQRQNLPREVILKDNRARILREMLNQGKNRLRGLLPTAISDQEQSDLQSKIMTLQLLETRALREAQTDDQLAEIRRQIDSLLPETTK